MQEFDALSIPPDPSIVQSEHMLQTLTKLWEVITSRGVNVRFGRELFPVLEAAGLREVAAIGHVMMHRGGTAGAQILRANFEQMHDALVDAGFSQADYNADLERLGDPSVLAVAGHVVGPGAETVVGGIAQITRCTGRFR